MPLPNSKMREGRFLRWHTARKRIAWIKQELARGRIVQITTATKAWRFRAYHADYFKATPTGAYVKRGGAWDCIDYVQLNSYRPVKGRRP